MKNYLRRLYTLLILLVVSTAMAQATNAFRLCIELKNGQKEYYNLTEQPVLSFAKDTLLVETTQLSTKLPFSNMERAYVDVVDGTPKPDDDTQAIDSTIDDRPENGVSLSFAFDGHTVKMATQDELPPVHVYSVGGLQVQPEQERGVHSVTIHMDGLPQGVYVISVADRSYKIAVK